MEMLWQYVVIGLLLGAAVVYLVVHFVRRRRKDSCRNCAAYKAIMDRQPKPGPQASGRQTSNH